MCHVIFWSWWYSESFVIIGNYQTRATAYATELAPEMVDFHRFLYHLRLPMVIVDLWACVCSIWFTALSMCVGGSVSLRASMKPHVWSHVGCQNLVSVLPVGRKLRRILLVLCWSSRSWLTQCRIPSRDVFMIFVYLFWWSMVYLEHTSCDTRQDVFCQRVSINQRRSNYDVHLAKCNYCVWHPLRITLIRGTWELGSTKTVSWHANVVGLLAILLSAALMITALSGVSLEIKRAYYEIFVEIMLFWCGVVHHIYHRWNVKRCALLFSVADATALMSLFSARCFAWETGSVCYKNWDTNK